LGGGRRTIEDTIDPAVGFVIPIKPGDRVKKGEAIASVFARDRNGIATGMLGLKEAIVIGETGTLTPLISHRVTAESVNEVSST
jgi:pyrimidine-nucleoside phosphorylase/thymidine phosphorylase